MKFTSDIRARSERFITDNATVCSKFLARSLQVSVLVLFLAGCAGLPPKSLRVAAEGYTIMGKLIVIQPEQRIAARFRWIQQAENFQMDLWGPLGVGRTSITGTSIYAELKQGTEVIERGVPSEIMQRQLGWSAPIEVFPYWIKGTVAPNAVVESAVKDKLGRLMKFSQAGWSVSYAGHVQEEGGWWPSGITIAGLDLQLRLIIVRKSPG